MSTFYNNTFDDGRFKKDYIGERSLFTFCVRKIRFQNKTLIRINYSYLLITLGLVHINDTVVSAYEMHQMHIACYRLVHENDTRRILHVTGLVHENCTIYTLHVTVLVLYENCTICTLHVTELVQ